MHTTRNARLEAEGGSRPEGRARGWAFRLVVGFGVVALLMGCSRTGTDFAAAQSSLIEHSGCDWARQIRIGVPSLVFTVARAGLSFVPLEPEVRAALQTMRGLRVALYERARGTPDCRAMLRAADTALTERGWDRVVGVLDRRELVAVYAPTELSARGTVELCVIAFDGDQLVFVSGRADPEPLVEVGLRKLAAERPPWLARAGSEIRGP